MRKLSEILINIDNFIPDDGIWLKLDDLLIELQETNELPNGIKNLFKIFERFPNEDGAGVFWAILHSIESVKDYEIDLLKSIKRKPTEITITMLRRIHNSGQEKIGGIKVLDICLDSLSHKKADNDVIDEIKDLINDIITDD